MTKISTTMTIDSAAFGLLNPEDAQPWSDREAAALDAHLWALLEQQMQKRTQGDSTSMRVEEVEELIASIRFTLRNYLQLHELTDRALLTDDLSGLFRHAQRDLETLLKETRRLYEHAVQSVRVLGCKALHDTLQGIALFFTRYDFRLFAHQIPAEIDYQLCHPVAETCEGVGYIRDYLVRLLAENELLLRLDQSREIALLRRAQPDYGEMLMNVYEPIAASVIGLSLSGGGETLLELTPQQGERVTRELQALPSAEGAARLVQAAALSCEHLGIQGAFTKSYLAQTAVSLLPRLTASKDAYWNVFSVRSSFL